MIVFALKAWDILKSLATPRNLIVAAVAALALFAWIQSKQLTAARAALINPVTKVTWQREAIAAQADLKTCQGSKKTLKAALDEQTAAIKAQKALNDGTLTESAQAAQAALSVAASAKQTADRILSQHLTGATACERAEDARRRYVESLK